jgi:hypothetical protein
MKQVRGCSLFHAGYRQTLDELIFIFGGKDASLSVERS